MQSWDLGFHDYVRVAHQCLTEEMAYSHVLVEGDSAQTLRVPLDARKGLALTGDARAVDGTATDPRKDWGKLEPCDFVFVDGAHYSIYPFSDLAHFGLHYAKSTLGAV